MEFGHGADRELIERRVGHLLQISTKIDSPESQLATTCALEHFTAIMAQFLIGTDPGREFLGSLEHRHARLWVWHAREELEHKAVAFDMYNHVCGSYVRRCWTMLRATFFFLAAIALIYLRLLSNRGILFSPHTWWSSLKFLMFRPGILPRLVLPWLAYFKPGFHPWEEDDSSLVSDADSLVVKPHDPSSSKL